MIQIPNIAFVRQQWKLEQQLVHDWNEQLATVSQKYQERIEKFVAVLKKNPEGVYGLSDYFNFGDKDEAYIVHMSLLRHPNVLIALEDKKAKYSYANSNIKYAMGAKALGLQFLTLDGVRKIRKTFRTANNTIFVNILLIMNSVLGLAINKTRKFNIVNLSKSLALSLDDTAMALSILSKGNFINTSLSEEEDYQYEFTCSKYFENYIKEIQMSNLTTQRDVFAVKLDLSKIQEKYNFFIEFLQKNTSRDNYINLPQMYLDTISAAILKVMLCKHPNIAFKPASMTSLKKVVYHYAYVDSSIKKNELDKVVAYRFIPQNVLSELFQQSKAVTLSENIVDSFWLLDYLYRYANTSKITFTSTILKNLGFYNLNIPKNCIHDLAKLNCFSVAREIFNNKQVTFDLILPEQLYKKNANASIDTASNNDLINSSQEETSIANNVDSDVQISPVDSYKASIDSVTLTDKSLAVNISEQNMSQHQSISQRQSVSQQNIIQEQNQNNSFNYELDLQMQSLINQVHTLNQTNARLLMQLAHIRSAQYSVITNQMNNLITDEIGMLKCHIYDKLQELQEILKDDQIDKFNTMSASINKLLTATNLQIINKLASV